ncbi:MAG TPA: tetratricopeptide repeat protein [Pyrinomonadaceae bacterium]|nr:tetratricopeptide repeat protein [Pyrinomonadaceae bacterium]
MKTRFIDRSFALKLALAAVSLLCIQADAQTRSITVSAEPNAIVWIDGVNYGKTSKAGSLQITTVAAGAHTLKVRADGFKEKSQPLTAIQKGTVTVPLVKTTDEAELAFQEAERLAGADRDKSAEAYKKAIKLRSAYPEAFVGLARVLTELADYEAAQSAIASARKLRPGYAEASAVQGRIYNETADEAKAIAAFKRAITEGKGFQPEAYAGLGILYKEKAEGFGGSGDFANETANYLEAAKNLKLSVKQLSGAPDAIVIYQLLGLVYERQKKYPEAIATYEEFLRIFPNTADAEAIRSIIVQLKKEQNPQD